MGGDAGEKRPIDVLHLFDISDNLTWKKWKKLTMHKLDEKSGQPALLHLDSWAGRTSHSVTILRETNKHYLIRWDDDSVFGRFIRGTVRKVPKFCITFKEVR